MVSSTIREGNMSYRHGSIESVTTNRDRFLGSLGLQSGQVYTLNLEHGTKIQQILTVDANTSEMKVLTGDGLITNQNLAMFVLTADCLPLVVFDSRNKVYGVFHAGWQGLHQGFPEKIINCFLSDFSCSLENIYVAIGPHIYKENYLHKEIEQQSKDWSSYVRKKNDQYQVDLTGFTISKFNQLGVKPEHTWVSPINTYTSKDFFSHRAAVHINKTNGRFATTIFPKIGW